MYLNSIAHYIPDRIVPNSYYEKLNGLEEGFIIQRTGIHERRAASEGENTNTMSVESVNILSKNAPYSLKEVDLIVGATYTPYDTVGTMAHWVQKEFEIPNAAVITLSSACSSLVNAVEIAEGYFAMNKATKALVIATEHNTYYNNETNVYSGHLWGDGSVAMLISKEKINEQDAKIIDIMTCGLSHIDKGPEGVYLRPRDGGILMPDGKNVFINACKYMASMTEDILKKNDFTIADISYYVPHQANKRIIDNVAKRLELKEEQTLTNIALLGNTGCASCGIALSQNYDSIEKGKLVVISVFGGGYSSGSMLIEK
jgi:3-oxoacyl-[acyl-carrier-protein] synthase-3